MEASRHRHEGRGREDEREKEGETEHGIWLGLDEVDGVAAWCGVTEARNPNLSSILMGYYYKAVL